MSYSKSGIYRCGLRAEHAPGFKVLGFCLVSMSESVCECPCCGKTPDDLDSVTLDEKPTEEMNEEEQKKSLLGHISGSRDDDHRGIGMHRAREMLKLSRSDDGENKAVDLDSGEADQGGSDGPAPSDGVGETWNDGEASKDAQSASDDEQVESRPSVEVSEKSLVYVALVALVLLLFGDDVADLLGA